MEFLRKKKCSTSRDIHLFIHISRCLNLRSSPTKGGGDVVTFHGYPRGRKAYNRVQPSSPRASFALCYYYPRATMPSALPWAEQSHVSQRVSQLTSPGYSFHICYHIPRGPGYSRPACVTVTPLRIVPPHLLPSPHTLRYGPGFGFMGGEIWRN